MIDFYGIAASASSEAKILGSKMTQTVLSGVAAASLEAKLIGLKLSRADLSEGLHCHFILVG